MYKTIYWNINGEWIPEVKSDMPLGRLIPRLEEEETYMGQFEPSLQQEVNKMLQSYKGKFAPDLLTDTAKNMEWWQAEHDRAKWEDDNTPENVKQEWARNAEKFNELGIEPIYWNPMQLKNYGTT